MRTMSQGRELVVVFFRLFVSAVIVYIIRRDNLSISCWIKRSKTNNRLMLYMPAKHNKLTTVCDYY